MICNEDCLNCPYPDCIKVSYAELDEELRKVRNEAVREANLNPQPAPGKKRRYHPTKEQRAETRRAWEKKNADRIRERKRRLYQENREKVIAKNLEYYYKNRERILARMKAKKEAGKQ